MEVRGKSTCAQVSAIEKGQGQGVETTKLRTKKEDDKAKWDFEDLLASLVPASFVAGNSGFIKLIFFK